MDSDSHFLRPTWRFLHLLLVLGGCVLSGCGGGSSSPPPPPPPPSISSISPNSVTAGGAPFTLTVNGSNFISGATVVWSNAANPGSGVGSPTVVSSSQLTLQVSAADIAIPGTVQLSVTTSAGKSNTSTFVISPGAGGGAHSVSLGTGGVTPNGGSHYPMLSFNGRFVAFSSEATNLIVGGTKFAEAYMRDTCLGADNCAPSTLLVSAQAGGSPGSPVEGNSLGGALPSITFQGFAAAPTGTPTAGRYVGFPSGATNLVNSNTTSPQAYFRDTCFLGNAIAGCTPTTVLVSTNQSGTEPNGPAYDFVMASDTCNGAFVSSGTDLLSGVTTPNEIYLTSCLVSGSTVRFTTSALVSASSSGVPGDQGGQQPAISADGRFVAFASSSTNLTSTPNGGFQQIYVRDTCLSAPSGCAPSTAIVSVDSGGNALGGNSQVPSISDDGRFVVFATQFPLPTGGITSIVYRRDTCNSSSRPVANCAPSTTTISVAADGSTANAPSNSARHAISGDGRFVVFDSGATNLVSGGSANPGNQVYVRDTCNSSSGNVSGCTPSTNLVSVSNGSLIGGGGGSISDDGHFVAFENESVANVFQIFMAASGF